MAGQVAAARYDEAMFVMRLRDATDRARAGAPISRPEWSGILMRAQQAMSVSHWRRTMRVEIDRQTALAAYLARFETWEQAATGAVM